VVPVADARIIHITNKTIMNCCILFSLPEALSRVVLVEWLRFFVVIRLDSAFCCRELRPLFLELAYNPSTVFRLGRNGFHAQNGPILEWAAIRKAQPDGVVTDGRLVQYRNSLCAFLSVSGLAVNWVEISSYGGSDTALCSQQALLEIAKWCPNILELDLLFVYAGDGALRWDEHLEAFARSCRKLTGLSLSYTRISMPGLASALQYCECLQRLSIYVLRQAIPVEIALPTLKFIACSASCMTDAVLYAIGQRCSKLETLYMFEFLEPADDRGMTDVGVRAALEGCPLLRETDVEFALHISTEIRVELARRRDMTTLEAKRWWGMNDELAQAVLAVSPSLTTLSCAERCEWLTNATLAVCAQRCPLVTNVTLQTCILITDHGVRVLVSRLASRLRYVDLQNCPRLSDDTMLAIADHCPQLETVVCIISSVSNTAVVKLAEGCNQLAHVYLCCTQVGDAGLVALATHCPKLTALDLCGCGDITLQGVSFAVEYCLCLKRLVLPKRCSGLPLPRPGTGLQVLYE
jgi:hypothetical protein